MELIVGVVILLIMIILDLFFFVCLTSIINKGAYSNNPDLFDLFYYEFFVSIPIYFGISSQIACELF